MTDGDVVVMKSGNSDGAKVPCFRRNVWKVARARGLAMVYQPRQIRFRRYRPHCKRKPKENRPQGSTVSGTRFVAKTFCVTLTDDVAPIADRPVATRRALSKSSNRDGSGGWKDCGRSCRQSSMRLDPCCVCGFPKPMAVKGHWGFLASETVSSRWLYCW